MSTSFEESPATLSVVHSRMMALPSNPLAPKISIFIVAILSARARSSPHRVTNVQENRIMLTILTEMTSAVSFFTPPFRQ
jgi:hypothetical protein